VCHLVWHSDQYDEDSVARILGLIKGDLFLDKVFATKTRNTVDLLDALHGGHIFRGMICYYGLHYVVIFFHWPSMSWILFDDCHIRHVADWTAVVKLCLNGSFQPSILFFEESVSEPCTWKQFEDFKIQFYDKRLQTVLDAKSPERTCETLTLNSRQRRYAKFPCI